jgi:hypothetical protein
MSENMLAPTARLWREAAPEFDPEKAVALESEVDLAACQSMAEALIKVSKWMDHAIIKLGACAVVADEKDSEGLKPVAAEVVKAFIAAMGTMMSLRRGAGPCLCRELRKAGQDLASSLEELGDSVGKPSMSFAAGKALDCAQRLEHISTHNRLAIKKQLEATLSQLRDGHRDLQDAMRCDSRDHSDIYDEDAVFDDPLDPDEVLVAEATNATVIVFEETIEKAIRSCSVQSLQHDVDSLSVHALEIIASCGTQAADAIDGLIVHVAGGLDPEEFTQSLEQLGSTLAGLADSGLDVRNLEESLRDVHATLAKAGLE